MKIRVTLACLSAVGTLLLTMTACGCEHAFSKPTCAQPATCSLCGETNGEPSDMHSYSIATCTEPRTCRVCGNTDGEPSGHKAVKATCIKDSVCSRCDMVLEKAFGHTLADATCTVAKTCTRCGTIIGTPLGHNYDNNGTCTRCNTTDPSYTNTGTAQALSKIMSYVQYLPYEAQAINTRVELYKINGDAAEITAIIKNVSNIYEYSRKVLNACKGYETELHAVILECENLEEYPVYTGDDISYTVQANGYARKAEYLVTAATILAEQYAE